MRRMLTRLLTTGGRRRSRRRGRSATRRSIARWIGNLAIGGWLLG